MDGRQRIARCCDYEKIIIIFDFFTPPQVLHFRRGFAYLKLNFYELYVQNIVHIEYKLGEEKNDGCNNLYRSQSKYGKVDGLSCEQ